MGKTTEKIIKHPLVLGKCSKDSEEGDGYTIYKNTNEEIVNEIKALQIDTDTWEEWGVPGKCRVAQELNEKQRLCVNEEGHYFVKDVDSFKRTNRNKILTIINKKFDAAEVLTNSLGPLYTKDGYKKVFFKSRKKGMFGRDTYDEHGKVLSEEIGVDLNTYSGIVLSEGVLDSRFMFCHIDESGNVLNRDHNYNINYCLNNKLKTRKNLVEEIIAAIPDVPYETYGNKWFYSGSKKKKNSWEDSDGFVLVLHKDVEPYNSRGTTIIHMSKTEHKTDDTYGSGSSRIKKPKNTTPATKNDILSQILPLVNTLKHFGEAIDLSPYIDLKKLEVSLKEKKTIVKRVQKTKLKESSYDIYDFTNGDYDINDYFDDDYEREELLKALSNIENGIEPGESEDVVRDIIIDFLKNGDLPSFSFNKGEKQENHDKFKGLVKLPHGCNFTFKVEEGDACEITWAHSIYCTDVVEFELVP